MQRAIITTTLLIIITALAYLIGGRNALICLTVAFLIALMHFVKKWWNKQSQLRIERKVKQQLAQTPKRTTFPTIPGMKNPLQEDQDRAEKKQGS